MIRIFIWRTRETHEKSYIPLKEKEMLIWKARETPEKGLYPAKRKGSGLVSFSHVDNKLCSTYVSDTAAL